MARLPAGTIIAGYRIEDVAGEGGMGVVYRAIQIGLERARVPPASPWGTARSGSRRPAPETSGAWTSNSNSVVGRPLAGSPAGADELEVGTDALWLTGSSDGNTVLRIQP